MVAMRMADQDVFDITWIESELGEAVDDLWLGCVVEQCVDDDDALAGGQCPRRMDLRPDEVERVEHLVWLCVPRGAIGHRADSRRGVRPAAGPAPSGASI